ncbi:MAG: EAL domain-containing protein, partial [Clostridia bacterium]
MPALKTILIVDDSAINRKILSKILSTEYMVRESENGSAALELLHAQVDEIVAVLLDLVMPVMNGYAFLREIAKSSVYQNLPIVVLTGNGDKEHEKQALQLGAWDFVSKPYDAQIIRFRLRNAIVRSQLSAFQQLKYLTEYDTLTGIYNKAQFFREAHALLQAHPQESFVFARFDIDRFQLINSFFGAKEGNRLLQYIAAQLKRLETYSGKCVYGRIEADIFGICMHYQSRAETCRLVEVVRTLLKAYNINFDIVPSIGLYLIEDIHLPIDTMYDRATLAAKRCKGSYVNLYAFYDEKMSESLIKEQAIVNDMNAALMDHQFAIYYQPKYNIQTNLPAGAEALVRWMHPERGMISPGEFIPIFERNGFISKLDFYVWESVCQRLRRWIDTGERVLPVSVNVSRVNLYNPQIVNMICALVKQYDISPALLNLELTESAYMDNPAAMIETMTRLQEKGFVIMMDDFGSGYSSLNVLKDIAVDVLKIDMRFLSKTKIEGRGENIIASVVRMAKWLNIPVVAEGVETQKQVKFLRGIGCEFVQGYYFARPMPVEQYEALIRQSNAFIHEEESGAEFDVDLLWTSNAQMELLFENMIQATAIFEFSHGRVELLRANHAFSELLGYEDMGKRSRDLMESVHESFRQVVSQTFAQAVSTKSNAECEYMRDMPDGRTLWIQMRLKYINKVGGKHLLFSTLSDVTTQKEIDDELQKYRAAVCAYHTDAQKLAIVENAGLEQGAIAQGLQEGLEKQTPNLLLLDMMDDALFVIDYETYEVLYINQAGLKLYGLPQHAQTRKCYQIVHGLDAPCAGCVREKFSYHTFYPGR